ncbi:uncharacterized protein LOC135426192 [Drosophila montana]|uniref:uncharacterized protein LOC135426192 n=1 Tax=Drosophila montana TaxID=40370 RepID=UPI00313DC18A
MANTGGPRQRSRRLICNVVQSMLLYASSIWGPAIRIPSYSRKCRASYRRCALRVLCAFRTVLDDAAVVLAGIPPLKLLATEDRIAARNREATLEEWQARWASSPNGSWTKRIVPDLRPWV